ncbi:unnamed protein product [Bursaphelenchus xylophilus]|uniref:(pine wood nematode) hypothetical protein n=1 Tax=Bursaphelenchus xylophilus TaxID=6326 RepID=A0A1I7S334_BURXY|nr:unnamed protein product [Bursaphelenchus xylophilus]CAG9116081.1 unnamed protein product [Bursaphelenchus xylophilus]
MSLAMFRISRTLGRFDASISGRLTGACGIFLSDYTQYRGRKRALKKPLSRQEKLARRIKREEKEAARKQFSFMERIKIRRMRKMQSPSEMGPGRYDESNEQELPQRPVANVYIKTDVKQQFYSISEALMLHRMQQRPEIYNNLNAPVKLRIELDMTTEKASRMIPASDEIIPVPYPFDHNEKRSILAFAADIATQDEAIEAGAEVAVGLDMVKKIVKGQFRIDDYDFCVAHNNMAGPVLAPLRGLLKSRYPSKVNGAMGEDLKELVEKFKKGVKLAIYPDGVYPMWGLAEPVVGRLDMPDEHIQENIRCVVEALCKHRNPALGPFVNRCMMTLIPSKMFIPVDVSRYMPVASEEQIEKLQNRKKKKAKKVEEVKTEKDPDEYLVSLM